MVFYYFVFFFLLYFVVFSFGFCGFLLYFVVFYYILWFLVFFRGGRDCDVSLKVFFRGYCGFYLVFFAVFNCIFIEGPRVDVSSSKVVKSFFCGF